MNIARARNPADSSALLVHASASPALRRAALWGLVAAKMLAGWGLQWDIQWHVRIGRDSFWIAPHVMTYAGVGAVVLLSFGILAWDTWRHRRAPAAGDAITVLRITGTPGFHLAAWGIALTVLAAPIDDLWHRLFGVDVTIWSPPHLLGLLGSLINTAACLIIAREVYPQGGMARTAAVVVNAALLLGGLITICQPAFRLAYLHGGVAFHLYAILGAALFPLAHVTAARLSGLRTAPVLVLVMSVAIGITGTQIARVGFEMLRPVSVIEEEIAKDPTSPIAVANAIARKNGERPGVRTLALQVRSLIPVLALVVLDPRRRPVTSTVAYGLMLLATTGWALAHSPAFAPMAPDAGPTLIALILTILAALAAAAATRWLSTAFAASSPGRSTPE